MKISVNDQPLFTLSDTQKKVLCNDLDSSNLESDLKRRLQWSLMQKYEECFKRFKEEWDPKLKASGVSMIPVDEQAYAELVFKQPNYKDRKAREALV